MSTKVLPLQVSPFIKGARWSLLTCGFLYGIIKLNSYRKFDAKIKPLRDKAYIEEKEAKKEKEHLSAINDITLLAQELGVTEFPPDWGEGF